MITKLIFGILIAFGIGILCIPLIILVIKIAFWFIELIGKGSDSDEYKRSIKE